MSACVYCQTENNEPSAEHVIADGLGGCIVLPSTAVCKNCNNALNEDIDRPVQRDLTPLIAQLGIKGKRGNVPKWVVTETINGVETRLRIDHESVEAADRRKLISRSGNTFEFRANSVEELERAREELAAKFPGKKVELDVQGPVELSLPERRVDFVEFSSDHWRRWAAKTSLNAICYVLGPEAALAPDFDDLRQHALTGAHLGLEIKVGGVGKHAVDEIGSIPAEHRISVEIANGVLLVRVTLFDFCGLSLRRGSSRLVDFRREITIDAAAKRVAFDSSSA